MYRAVALLFLDGGEAVSEENAERLLMDTAIEVTYKDLEMTISVNGRDVTELIRTTDVTRMSSIVSTLASVRKRMVNDQRRIARRESERGVGVIVEGRDIGTVVFPDAEVKIYLDADPGERARRRVAELQGGQDLIDSAAIEAEIRERDERDRTRELSPLRKAGDAFRIDTTNLTVEEQLERIESIIRERDDKRMVKE